MLRAIKPIPLIGLTVKDISSYPPRFDWADPKTLLVEDEYQRRLTKRSITLIRKIAVGFDWLHIKPPVCARGAGAKLCVVDGQHTAIAAASRGVAKIPVMIVEAPEMARRARAFVAHSTDRLNVTPLRLFASRLAAGDRCFGRSAGRESCRRQPMPCQPDGQWHVERGRHTKGMVNGVERLVAKFGEEKALRVLKTLVAAKRAPR